VSACARLDEAAVVVVAGLGVQRGAARDLRAAEQGVIFAFFI
jgi:hypothetical protein